MGLGPSTIVSIVSVCVSALSLSVHIFTALNQRQKAKRQRRVIEDLLSHTQNCTCNEVRSEYQGQLVVQEQNSRHTKGKIVVMKKSYLDTGQQVLKVVTEIPFSFS